MKKPKNIREYLVEAVATMPPEEQQAEREALKAGKLTPAMAAALLLLLEESAGEPTKAVAPVLDLAPLTSELRGLKAVIKEQPAAVHTVGLNETETRDLLKRLAGIEDHVRAVRPATCKTLLVCALLGVVIGGLAGWYGRIEYRAYLIEQAKREAR